MFGRALGLGVGGSTCAVAEVEGRVEASGWAWLDMAGVAEFPIDRDVYIRILQDAICGARSQGVFFEPSVRDFHDACVDDFLA